MRIFFSYANDANRSLVERLRDDLSGKHDIWTYTKKIQPGEDWRRSIVDGLMASQLTVGFLSRKSTGDAGVCLDELAIALHVKNGAIATILVEPEERVRPPVSLSHIQWLDMHDWAERQRRKATWKKWYGEKLAAISALIDHPRTRHFSGEIDELQRLLQPASQSAEIGVLLEGFVGREWLARKVENWRRTAKRSRLFWLVGGAGMGKSAFSAWLAHHGKANVVGINLCRYNMDERRDAPFVVRTIAFHIASRLPDYRRFVLERLRIQDPDGSGLTRKGAPALFEWLLAEPLRLSIDGGRSDDRFLVVIDGLDETILDGRSEITEVLATSAAKLPDWMGIVVTSRHDHEIERQFADLQPLVIDAESARNEQDIRAYVRGWLKANYPAHQSLAEPIVAAAKCNFLYVRKFREGVETRVLRLTSPQDLPKGLIPLYGEWFRRQFPTTTIYNTYIPVLEVLATAEHPVPADWLRRIFSWSKRTCATMMEGLGTLFERRPEGVTPFHRSLRDWMIDDRAKGANFMLDAGAGKRRLVDALWNWFTSLDRAAADQTFDAFWVSELPIQIKRMQPDAVRGLPAIATDWRKTWGALAAQANALASRLDWDGALAWWQMAAFLAEVRGPDAQADKAFALRLSGDAARTLGRSRDALDAFESSLAVGKVLVERNAASLETRRELALSHTRIADVLRDRADREGAFAAYQQALDIMRALADAQPDNVQWMREVAVYLERIGDVQALNRNWTEALESIGESLDIRRKLCRLDGRNTQWRHDLLAGLGKFGDVLIDQAGYFDQPDFSGALQAYREAFAIVSELCDEAPGVASWRHARQSIKSRIGDVLVKEKHISEAIDAYQESLDLIRGLVDQAPSNTAWRRDLAVGLSNLGDALLLLPKPQEAKAIALYREALEVMRRLSAHDPYNTGWEIEVVCLLWRLAEASDAAYKPISEAIAILRRLETQKRLTAEQQDWIATLKTIARARRRAKLKKRPGKPKRRR